MKNKILNSILKIIKQTITYMNEYEEESKIKYRVHARGYVVFVDPIELRNQVAQDIKQFKDLK